ncbi:MAG: ammonia-forming cytochrome c nitrite reductase subunit c552 [Myxococcota bacterium]
MSFKSVFIAVFIGTALIVAALLLHGARPERDLRQPAPEFVEATGKCATCHRNETSAVVHQYERSSHAANGVTCLDCHRPMEGQEGVEHRGFTISEGLTAANCKQCHVTEYDQYARSRHAAPAWAAVRGAEDFTEEQIADAERYHPGTVERPANKLAQMEGAGAIAKGCGTCHSVGKPNDDGSIGTCTHCHSRHDASVALARQPSTCGQCHMGPDHSQLEIYMESKHGALFEAQSHFMNLDADPKELTTADMPVPTCATCHMSGLEGMGVTHDTTERLSWYLFAPVSEKRPAYARGQDEMKQVCTKCHTKEPVDRFFEEAETVLHTTNEKVAAVNDLVASLREEGLLTPEPFDEPIEFQHFDYWHYYGRTAKHGAFMGGADFVQWHGNYELLLLKVEIEHMAEELRAGHGGGAAPHAEEPAEAPEETAPAEEPAAPAEEE